MGAVRNCRFTDDQWKTFEHIKMLRESKTNSSVFNFLLECGSEKMFGDNTEKSTVTKEIKTIKNELSELREEHKKALKYLHAIAESISIVNKRNNSRFEGIEEMLRKLIK